MDHSGSSSSPSSSAAADVLVEARRNLQVLIDSGVPRHVLHQMLEESDPQSYDAFLSGTQHPAQPQPYHHHRPRVSVSSTSSGSSGHASLWSISTASSAGSAVSGKSGTSTGTGSSATTTRGSAPAGPPKAALTLATPGPANPLDPASAAAGSSPSSAGSPNSGSAMSARAAAAAANLYCCTSCDTTFKRKYDWKRHEDEFHERWKKYPCPEPGCNRSFWGANTFNQHHKQSHGCKSCPHSEKVVRYLRRRKYWACGFCSALHPSRERHVEHVARDFESGKTKAEWMHSRVIYGLLHQPLIHDAWKTLVLAKQQQGDHQGRPPNFSWDPTRTGRAQGFLEGESPGQLQDHLEFFSGGVAEAHKVALAAYAMADVMVLDGSGGAGHDQLLLLQPPSSPQECEMEQQQQQPAGDHSRSQQHMGQPLLNFAMAPPPPPSAALSPAASSPMGVAGPAMLLDDGSAAVYRHSSSAMMHHHPHPHQQHPHQQHPHPQHPPGPAMFHHQMATSARPQAYPMPLRRSSLDRALPPPPPAEAMEDQQPAPFPYLPNPAPVVMDDWQTFAAAVVEDAAAAASQAADWSMVDYFDPGPGPV